MIPGCGGHRYARRETSWEEHSSARGNQDDCQRPLRCRSPSHTRVLKSNRPKRTKKGLEQETAPIASTNRRPSVNGEYDCMQRVMPPACQVEPKPNNTRETMMGTHVDRPRFGHGATVITQYQMNTTSSIPIDVYPESLATCDGKLTTNRLTLDLSLALDFGNTPLPCPNIPNADSTTQRQAKRHCPLNESERKTWAPSKLLSAS